MNRLPRLPARFHIGANLLTEGPRTPSWSAASQHLFEFLDLPLADRPPAPYRHDFAAIYVPNQSAYLPRELSTSLRHAAQWQEGRYPGQFARAVGSDFVIDLSWSSAYLDEHPFTREQTASLFELGDLLRGAGAAHPYKIQTLINHKLAIEQLVALETRSALNVALALSVNEQLLDRLLDDGQELGHLRRGEIDLGATAYEPLKGIRTIHDELSVILAKAEAIRDPIEAALFLWIHVSYLQPFLEGNEASARLLANVPIAASNCAPLTFNRVGQRHYRAAMLGIYERNDISAAVDLFTWPYWQSIRRYTPILSARPLPDPRGPRFREELLRTARAVIVDGHSAAAAIAAENLKPSEARDLGRILSDSLAQLSREEAGLLDVQGSIIDGWIAAGRPY